MFESMDTLQTAKELEASGFTPEQSEGVARVLAQGPLVTETRLERAVAELKLEMWKMAAVIIGGIGAIAALFRLFE